MSYFLFFIATVLAGTINALAGGGGLIIFPLLILVVTPVTADATSAVALFFAYPTAVWRTRDQLAGVFGRAWLWLLLIPSVLGGLVGAVLLSRTGNRNFIQLVPWLVLVATVIIVLRPILVRRDESGGVHPDITVAVWPVAIAGIFLVGLYGGYFGAGIGILMIGALSFISRGDIRHVLLAATLGEWYRIARTVKSFAPLLSRLGLPRQSITSGSCTDRPWCGQQPNRRQSRPRRPRVRG